MQSLRLFILSILILCISCSKDKDNGNSIAGSHGIILKELQTNGHFVTLNWTLDSKENVYAYKVYRYIGDAPENPRLTGLVIADLNKSINTFTDTLAPYCGKVSYCVVASETVYSNPQQYVRNIKTYQIKSGLNRSGTYNFQIDKNTHFILAVEQNKGNALIIDPITETSRNLYLNSTIGKCGFGVYNSTNELYVTRSDGWLYIYNLADLSFVDQIHVSSSPLHDVTYNNGILFISTTNSDDPLYMIDRKSKTEKYSLKNFSDNNVNFLYVSGTNTELYGIDGQTISYYTFNSKTLVDRQYFQASDYGYPRTMCLVPNTTNMLTAEGFVFNKQFNVLQSLPIGVGSFVSMAIDQNQNVYGADYWENKITKLNLASNKLITTIQTDSKAVLLFELNNGIYVLEKTYAYDAVYSEYLAIAKISQ